MPISAFNWLDISLRDTGADGAFSFFSLTNVKRPTNQAVNSAKKGEKFRRWRKISGASVSHLQMYIFIRLTSSHRSQQAKMRKVSRLFDFDDVE